MKAIIRKAIYFVFVTFLVLIFIWSIRDLPSNSVLTEKMNELTEQTSTALGSNWTYSRALLSERFQDLKGRHWSLRERHELRLINIHNQYEVVDFYVFRYSDIDNTINRYIIQDEVLFFQLPTEESIYPYIDLNLETNPNSDNSHVACQEIYSESVGDNYVCTAIFHYDMNIVVVEIGLQIGSEIYIANDQMNEIFTMIDNIFG